jgi:hypothetical protein
MDFTTDIGTSGSTSAGDHQTFTGCLLAECLREQYAHRQSTGTGKGRHVAFGYDDMLERRAGA